MKRIEYRWLRIIHKVDIQIKNHRFYPQSNSKSEQKKIFRFSVLHNNWLRTRRGSEQLQILYKFIDNIWSANFLSNHIDVGILLSLCVTVITIFAFGNKRISNMYLHMNKKIGDALMRSEVSR